MKSSSLNSLISGPSDPQAPYQARVRLAGLFPWLLLLGFLILSFILFGERLLPAREVTIQKVVTVRASSEPSEAFLIKEAEMDPWSGATLFQASGWIEPDPLPVKATALVNGVVATVSVLEGESVKTGQTIATLIQDDFEFDLETAVSELESLKGLNAAHEASIEIVEAEIDTLELRVKAGEMRRLELIDRRDRFANVGGGAVSEAERVSAELMLQTHESEVEALVASAEEIRGELKRQEAMRKDFEARIRKAKTEVSRRQLSLDRTEIKSPVDGTVLRLLVSPGQKRMLDMDDHDSATVAILYQPDFLQARIDVPLEEASQLGIGQAVRLRSNFLKDEIFEGTVSRIVGEADLQRNTLQVKVKIHEPDHRLRPDMLCRAEFLTAASEPAEGTALRRAQEGRVSVFVPLSALQERNGNQADVWVLDSSGERSEKRSVVLRAEERGDHLRVEKGLLPGEFVIVNPESDLASGERVKATTGGSDES